MYLGAAGMVCSVGLTAASACAAMRAGIAKFDELPYRDNQGEPIIGAMVPGLEPNLKRGTRLASLLAMAIKDALGHNPELDPSQIPLLVGIAEAGRPGSGAEAMLDRVQQVLGLQFHPTLSSIVPNGHTAGFAAIKIAKDLLAEQAAHTCMVCGVDSYIHPTSLLWLQQQWRLKTDGNSDGVIPGEAAAAIIIQRQPIYVATPIRVAGLGFSREESHIGSNEPLLGVGLAHATRLALAEAGLQLHEIDFRMSDVTGESYGFKELSLALTRVLRVRRVEFPLWHCADSIGDTGAAAGVCQIVVASHAFLRGAKGTRAICYTSAPQGERAVAILEISDS